MRPGSRGCPPSSMIYRCLRQFKNPDFPNLNGYLMLFAICRMPDVQTLTLYNIFGMLLGMS